ncbi:TetR/AcrR family transcriptional regulator [Anaeromyxobacter sp. Fw109-5]|uniref:TetR/AcrR family transcriptional regulator n=1 Tax=Anaeromyxobacter sp. (strain Fw109-5) TaxID=404589 RepID=UPI000158A48F|nr:TetR/AcrR family transcriptional regulator [Anaeromyxobacter sp. Fw109-5]ABS27836.1 transcriptional regulator, TetR family [Anaeromyxobacter sp. Fw109-5]
MPRPARPATRGTASPEPRDRLLDTAGRLFYKHGFRAVGIDRILAESGVAKMTLYRHFASKDELIAAYLERADREFWEWAESAMAAARTPEARLLALFDALARHTTSAECLGCPFQGAALAFPELEHPGHRRALRNKLAVRDRLASMAKQAGLRSSESLAAQLLLLMDGAWVAARVFGPGDNPGASVGQAARALIEAHRRASTKPSRG